MTRPRFAPTAWDGGLLAVVAVAVAIRLPYLTGRSLWYDEASSWQTATFSLPEMWRSVRLNVHMPLYYLLLKGWMAAWGQSVASLRGFSIAFGVLTVLAMDRFAREVYRASASGDDSESGRRGFGLVVAGLVAVSPFQVFGSIEARMYSLGTALAALGGWLLLRSLRPPGRRWTWWAYGATCAGLLHTHHFGLFSVAAQSLFLALYVVWLLGLGARAEARGVLAKAAAVGAVVAALDLPALALLRMQAGRVQQDYWINEMHWRMFWGTFSEFLVPTHGFDFLVGGQVVAAVACLSCVVVAIGGRRGDGLVLASALVPMLLAAAISTVQPIWVARYFRFAHLFLLTAVALAVWKVTRRSSVLRAILVVLLFGALLEANVVLWKHLDIPGGGGIREAVATILKERRPGEMIVTFDHHQYFPAKFYVGDAATIRLLPPEGLFWGWHLIRPADLITSGQLRAALRRGVWVIERDPDPDEHPELAGAVASTGYEFHSYVYLHRWLFVRKYTLPDEPSSRERPGP